ncbi:unnamed protein product [Rotaria sordida]|nr:unnamed protein product [Rotaria sordida]
MTISLQDYAPLTKMSQEHVKKSNDLILTLKFFFFDEFILIEKEIINCMTHVLKYLDVELNIPSSDRYSSLVKYRAIRIHYQLVSLLHNTFHIQNNITRRKRLRAFALLHYEKALELFSPNDNLLEYLRLVIEQVTLSDFELQNNDNFLSIFIVKTSFLFC